MEPQAAPHNTMWSFPFTPQDWEHTPMAVQAYVHTLHDELMQLRARVEALAARLARALRHLSPAAIVGLALQEVWPTHDRRHAPQSGGKLGHRQGLLPPTTIYELKPVRCACSNITFSLTKSFYTHQVIELPPVAMEVTHFVLPQSWCVHCGNWTQAQVGGRELRDGEG